MSPTHDFIVFKSRAALISRFFYILFQCFHLKLDSDWHGGCGLSFLLFSFLQSPFDSKILPLLFISYPFPWPPNLIQLQQVLFCTVSSFIFIKNHFLVSLFRHTYPFSNLTIIQICKNNVKIKNAVTKRTVTWNKKHVFLLRQKSILHLYVQKNIPRTIRSWDYKVPKPPSPQFL